ncbi:Golgin subfamily A member 7 [Myotis brandtii]|uniref:Golgin subfamily A member 7 n=1 Tax=Myotis brandtii TaxID=109478 RepID=S7PS48_MYOBR|nr:Golgin subfamily A member 7 [Myotis brandtii]
MRPQQAPMFRKVFIQRDYSSGTRCQFQTKFPVELENWIDRKQCEMPNLCRCTAVRTKPVSSQNK